jgi:hypothetical protein
MPKPVAPGNRGTATHHCPGRSSRARGGNAVFSRTERVSLITDERIPLDRRTYYAIEAIAGLRLGECQRQPESVVI